ncbi:RHS domain-containing protein [Pseudomonas putida]
MAVLPEQLTNSDGITIWSGYHHGWGGKQEE